MVLLYLTLLGFDHLKYLETDVLNKIRTNFEQHFFKFFFIISLFFAARILSRASRQITYRLDCLKLSHVTVTLHCSHLFLS